jgi:predicted nucleotidyltransferase
MLAVLGIVMGLPAPRLDVPQRALREFCQAHHIRSLLLFGSARTERFRADSDVDILVEFEPGHVPGFGLVDLEDELSRLFGRPVDLSTRNELSRSFRDRVLAQAEVLYAG